MLSRFKIASVLLAFALFPFAAQAADSAVRPMFGVLPPHGNVHPQVHFPAGSTLTTWTGTISYKGKNYSFSMVGTNPATTNTTTTIPVYIIPIKMVYGSSNGNMTFDPNTNTANGVSITQNLLNAPLFNATDWKWGSLDMGTTQYEDAFQRGTFWSDIQTNSSYHVLLATPVVLSEETITVSRSQGSWPIPSVRAVWAR